MPHKKRAATNKSRFNPEAKLKFANDPPDYLYDTKELALCLNCSRVQLEKLRAVKQGPPPIKLGHRTVMYRNKDVKEWINSFAIKQEMKEEA